MRFVQTATTSSSNRKSIPKAQIRYESNNVEKINKQTKKKDAKVRVLTGKCLDEKLVDGMR